MMMILMINMIIGMTVVTAKCPTQKVNGCFEQASIACCDGYILQVANETTATCVKCLAPGESCYQTNQPCCAGYRCGSGGPVFPEPRPQDRCISKFIIG
jgi:hypothetical protein